ncbi:MAG: UDP-2,3-diacylglucosamine diphosphatase [Pseudomonadota bacterium]
MSANASREPDRTKRRCRALFVSDLHLGMRGAQAERFLAFLKGIDAQTIYLVGDIVDGWKLRRRWYWPQSHNDVVQTLLNRARKGARMIYIPGNHDEMMRNFYGTHFGGIEVVEKTIHTAADGKRYLVIHGDQFDVVVRHARWLAFVGDVGYNLALSVNVYVNAVRRRLGFSYWSLSAWLKNRVKGAVNMAGNFERALSDAAEKAGADGVICGHIHTAAMHDGYGVHYINTGDWVESCTAVVENFDGTFEIIEDLNEARVIPLPGRALDEAPAPPLATPASGWRRTG